MFKSEKYWADLEARRNSIIEGICPECKGQLHSHPTLKADRLSYFECETCFTTHGISK